MRVALFVTCLVDLFRPSVGFASVSLLERLGAEVVVPPEQTCCGQPAYNNGDFETARAIARQVIAAFEGFDHVVVPSGSCAGMLVKHYPELFRDEPETLARSQSLAARTRELSVFLAESGVEPVIDTHFTGKVAMHDSCSARRELGIHTAPRALLDTIGAPGFSLYDQWEAQLLALIRLKARVGLRSELPDEDVRRAHLEPIADVGAAVARERDRIGKDAPVAVLPEGPQTIPYVS